jgi:hypothetical protein
MLYKIILEKQMPCHNDKAYLKYFFAWAAFYALKASARKSLVIFSSFALK